MIHLGVADMDFRAPVEIRDSLHKILDMGVLGYTDLSDKFFSVFKDGIKTIQYGYP